jgi:hypothetical protein
MNDAETAPAGLNGPERGKNGQFLPGNRAGKGNPLNRRAQQIRRELLMRPTDADIGEIVDALIRLAKSSDLPAIREYLDRTIGRPSQSELVDRVEKLEAILTEKLGAVLPDDDESEDADEPR